MRLDELGFVGRGKSKHRPRNDPSLYGGDYPFIQTGDVKEADLWLSHYPQTYNHVGLAQSKLWPAGTLCITIAANIAETAILKIPACFPDSIVGFIPHEGKSDVRFVKYFIDTIKLRMQNMSKGTTQDNLSVDKLLSFNIDVPDYTAQVRIASILSAYDDLIENNTRRIKILEEMAQMIYREWFVNFRFPGHQTARVTESGGLVGPEKWERTSVERACISVDDGDWIETKDQGGTSYRLLQISNIGLNKFVETGNHRFISEETFQGLGCKEVVVGQILIARMPTPIGRAWLVTPQAWKMITAVDIAILTPDSSRTISVFLLHFFNSPETLASSAAKQSGTTRARITRSQIAATPLLLPPIELQKRFARLAEPINQNIAVLCRLNSNLRETRNLLLPRLISGEISVEQLDLRPVGQI